MTIDLTREEYRQLLDMVQIARWVLHARKTEIPPETEAYNDLEQKIASYAPDVEMEDAIVYDEHLEGFFPTAEYEAEFLSYIDEYDNDVFWGELSSRLADRDLLDTEGEERVLSMEPFERVLKLATLEEKYIQEFSKHGIRNLMILKTPLLRSDLATEYKH